VLVGTNPSLVAAGHSGHNSLLNPSISSAPTRLLRRAVFAYTSEVCHAAAERCVCR
jgi:hypothetical protein